MEARPAVRLVIVGGFLGAGKTTALLSLARGWHRDGRGVGLITNDQAANLVDTGTLRLHGFRVEEVAGACFCCKFDDLARAADRLREEERPQVILAEPVGSCTDLAATVVAPLRRLHGGRYSVAPYSVMVDPARARQMVMEKGFGGFSPKVAYIFLKQLEEADIICLNKVDGLPAEERAELMGTLSREFPGASVIATSGLGGEGIEAWRALLEGEEAGRARIAEVDYDVYAEGEAELGWLNLSLEVEEGPRFDSPAAARALLERLRRDFAAEGAEVAHVKVLLHGRRGGVTANHVGAGSAVTVTGPAGPAAEKASLTINARVHADPALIGRLAEEAAREVMASQGATATPGKRTQLRPGRPVPTHRYASEG